MRGALDVVNAPELGDTSVKTAILQGKSLSFSYTDQPLLENVDIDIFPGEVLGILGPNGTGKSTLLGVLAGDFQPDSGQVLLRGKPLSSYSRLELARMRAVMPQNHDVPFAYTVREVVAMGRTPWREKNDEDEVIVEDALAASGIAHLGDREVTSLSGGERARATFSRVLAQNARLLMLDEPTAALDIAHQERLMRTCRSLVAGGAAVVLVIHDLQLAAAYCDRLVLLSRGKVFASGSVSEVLTQENLSEVYECPIRVFDVDGSNKVVVPHRA